LDKPATKSLGGQPIMIAQPETKRYTIDEYLELEIASEIRNEYCDGEISIFC